MEDFFGRDLLQLFMRFRVKTKNADILMNVIAVIMD